MREVIKYVGGAREKEYSHAHEAAKADYEAELDVLFDAVNSIRHARLPSERNQYIDGAFEQLRKVRSKLEAARDEYRKAVLMGIAP